MADEKITVTFTLEQAEALADAAVCMSVAADGDLESLKVFMPEDGADQNANTDYKRRLAEVAESAAKLMRPEIDGAYKRNPEMQDLLHAFKMHRKYGRFG